MQYRARTQHPKVFWFFRKHYHNNSKVPYVVPHPLNVVLAATMFTAIRQLPSPVASIAADRPYAELIIYLAFSFDTWQRNLNARAVRIGSWFAVVWYAASWICPSRELIDEDAGCLSSLPYGCLASDLSISPFWRPHSSPGVARSQGSRSVSRLH